MLQNRILSRDCDERHAASKAARPFGADTSGLHWGALRVVSLSVGGHGVLFEQAQEFVWFGKLSDRARTSSVTKPGPRAAVSNSRQRAPPQLDRGHKWRHFCGHHFERERERESSGCWRQHKHTPTHTSAPTIYHATETSLLVTQQCPFVSQNVWLKLNKKRPQLDLATDEAGRLDKKCPQQQQQ